MKVEGGSAPFPSALPSGFWPSPRPSPPRSGADANCTFSAVPARGAVDCCRLINWRIPEPRLQSLLSRHGTFQGSCGVSTATSSILKTAWAALSWRDEGPIYGYPSPHGLMREINLADDLDVRTAVAIARGRQEYGTCRSARPLRHRGEPPMRDYGYKHLR